MRYASPFTIAVALSVSCGTPKTFSEPEAPAAASPGPAPPEPTPEEKKRAEEAHNVKEDVANPNADDESDLTRRTPEVTLAPANATDEGTVAVIDQGGQGQVAQPPSWKVSGAKKTAAFIIQKGRKKIDGQWFEGGLMVSCPGLAMKRIASQSAREGEIIVRSERFMLRSKAPLALDQTVSLTAEKWCASLNEELMAAFMGSFIVEGIPRPRSLEVAVFDHSALGPDGNNSPPDSARLSEWVSFPLKGEKISWEAADSTHPIKW